MEPAGPLQAGAKVELAGVTTAYGPADWNGLRQQAATVCAARQRLDAESPGANGALTSLPVAAAYPAARTWSRWPKPRGLVGTRGSDGYQSWHAPRDNQQQVVSWIKRLTYAELQEGTPDPQLSALRAAIRRSVDGCTEVGYSARREALQFTFARRACFPAMDGLAGSRGCFRSRDWGLRRA